MQDQNLLYESILRKSKQAYEKHIKIIDLMIQKLKIANQMNEPSDFIYDLEQVII